MTDLWAYLPGALVLLLMSGFFSGSEAAFFSLTPAQRRQLSRGGRAERMAHKLLRRSERLLMGILFWNLAINIGYFSLASAIGLKLGESWAAVIALGSLLAIIVFGEFLPKSFAVTYPIAIARTVVVPLAVAVRIVDFLLPAIRLVNEASRRLIWPGFKSEPYLELSDLDRAIELSTENDVLFEQESQVLRNVVRLSEIRVEEWMRPRTQFRTFPPPPSLEQLGGEVPPSGFMLIADTAGREITSVVDVSRISGDPNQDLRPLQQVPVVVPWCATIADALGQLNTRDQRIALVVNEYGESIGVLTWEEIFEAVLQAEKSHSLRALARAEIRPEGPGVWLATGMTKLRRLERVIGTRLQVSSSLTIAGVMQEQLHRLAEEGDTCDYEGMHLEVIEAGSRGELLVRIQLEPEENAQSGEPA